MDFLNKSFAQLSELFRSMTPGSRLASCLLLVAIVVSLGFLFQHQVAGGDTYLLGARAFSSTELPGMEAAFAKAGLNGYEVEGNRVRVPRGQQAEYMAALADAGALPEHFGSHLTAAVTNMNWFSGRVQQEMMLKVARQKELSAIIRGMSGIENASVNYDERKSLGFRQTPVITASVGVEPSGNQPRDAAKIRAIRHLVAGAIANLDPQNVTIVDLRTGLTSTGSADGGSASDDPVLDRTRMWQNHYEESIRRALAYVPGVTVSATVELDREKRHLIERVNVDPTRIVALSSSEDSEISNTQGESRGGSPGLAAQQPNAANRLTPPAAGPTSSLERTSAQIENYPSTEKTTVENAPYTPKQVTVSIGIPSSYYEEVWRKINPAQAGLPPAQPNSADLAMIEADETIKIRDHVATLIPLFDTTADPKSRVQVTSFSNVLPAAIDVPNLGDVAGTWLAAHWTTLALLGLVMFSLMTLRSMVRAQPSPVPSLAASSAPAADVAEQDEETSAEDAEPAQAENRFRRRVPGRSLQEELADIVREDPDSAANVLRNWIGSAN